MNQFVSRGVALEFRSPILAMGGWNTAMGAAVHVPEASADVDDFPQSRKHEIRRPRQRAIMEAVTVAQGMHKTADNHLWRSVLRLDGRHDARTFRLGEGIGHGKLLDQDSNARGANLFYPSRIV